ncbi:hypothetical protein TWF730_003588 [Orbilia blumenaviensis]|uniref:Uncharacterized protein n=1 Tax=Orbilia blumenaviensis TaxID=1796055 RepID=A0AAV9U355_9PEZI
MEAIHQISSTDLFDRVSAWIRSTQLQEYAATEPAVKTAISPTSGQGVSRKRAFSEMSDTGDDRLTLQKRKHFHRVYPAPASTLAFAEGLEDAIPSDSISQVEIDLAIHSATGIRNLSIDSTSTSPTKSWAPSATSYSTASAAAPSSKSKRKLLATSTPNFKFLGLSGRAGLDVSDDINDWVPMSIRKLARGFSRSMSPKGMICQCVKDVILEYEPTLHWEDITFSDIDCDDQTHKQHLAEAKSIIEWVTESNDMHVDTTEENDWVAHSKTILNSVIARPKLPLHVNGVTSVDLVREFCPRTRHAARSRSSSPRKKQRGRSGTTTSASTSSRISEGVMTARADITVLIRDCGQTSALFAAMDDKFGFEAYIPPFKNFTEPPIITLEAKSLDGSSLEAENQTAICANTILESWRCLGQVAPYNPAPLPGYLAQTTEAEQLSTNPTNFLEYPTIERALPNPDSSISQTSPVQIGIDHVIGIQVASYNWSYTIVFATPSGEDDAKVQARRGYSRRVFGPHPIGDSRTVEGAYKISRFLHHLFIYKTKVWLPGIMQREPWSMVDGLV